MSLEFAFGLLKIMYVDYWVILVEKFKLCCLLSRNVAQCFYELVYILIYC
jgi:hypothetical protein